jgi:glycerophosphoryl diester phosphodiesterase
MSKKQIERGRDHLYFRGVQNAPEVIAHRGGGGEWPGETIYAFEQSLKAGSDVLEMDIRYTADDDLVLMHNANVKDTTGLDKVVSRLTSKEIQQLDASFWWKKAGAVFPAGSDASLRVPRLEDVIKQFQGVRMNIEIKPSYFPIKLVRKFCDFLRTYDMVDKVLVASPHQQTLHFIRRECEEVATSCSVIQMWGFRGLKAFNYKPNADAIQIMSKFDKLELITEAYVERAHNLNLVVHGWTVNKPEEMGRILSANLDGIITDYPTTLLKLLGRHATYQ